MNTLRFSSEPLVSVLTPVCNGEKFLAECIESIVAQTYQNWQYDIIDNCSTDESLKIAKKYAEKDKRIRVHANLQNVGKNENHNIAFSKMPIEAEYCKVVHADDWLFSDCIKQMVELMEGNSNVGIVGAYALANERVICVGLPYPSTVVSGREVCRRTLLGGPYVFGSPTSLLFRADIIRRRGKFFNQDNPHADKEACFEVLRAVDFGFVHQVLTYTRIHQEADSFRDAQNVSIPLGDLQILVKYGRDYLNEQDFEWALKEHWNRYYRKVGQMVIRNKSRDFWTYHKSALKRLGLSLDTCRVAGAAIQEILELILDPIGTFKRLRKKIATSRRNLG